VLTKADLYFNTSSQIQFHQGIDGLLSRPNDVQQALVGPYLILIPRVLVDVRRNKNGVTLDSGRQRDWASDLSPGATRRLHDFLCRCVNQAVIKSFEANTNTLVLHLVSPNSQRPAREPPKKEREF